MYLPIIDELNLTKSEQAIYNFLISKRDSISLYTELDIAKLTDISQPTISRFWKKIGFSNFKDFKETLKNTSLSPTPHNRMKETLNSPQEFDYKNYSEKAVAFLEESSNRIDSTTFNLVIKYFVNARSIHVFAIGPTQSLSSLLTFRLKRFGLSINDISATGHGIYESMIHIKDDDLLVLFLFNHYATEIHVLLDFAKYNNIKTVIITDLNIKPIDNKNILTLNVYRGEMLEFHSMIGPLFLIESIIMCIGMEKKESALENLKQLEILRDTYENYIPVNTKK